MIAYPFRLLQCCLVTDGGGALILVAAERVRDFPQKPVYLLGTDESVENTSGMDFGLGTSRPTWQARSSCKASSPASNTIPRVHFDVGCPGIWRLRP